MYRQNKKIKLINISQLSYKQCANGVCGICSGKVPQNNLNMFYCSDECCQEDWRIHHPDETEPDWDTIPEIVIER